jgi:hypothetical protein
MGGREINYFEKGSGFGFPFLTLNEKVEGLPLCLCPEAEVGRGDVGEVATPSEHGGKTALGSSPRYHRPVECLQLGELGVETVDDAANLSVHLKLAK